MVSPSLRLQFNPMHCCCILHHIFTFVAFQSHMCYCITYIFYAFVSKKNKFYTVCYLYAPADLTIYAKQQFLLVCTTLPSNCLTCMCKIWCNIRLKFWSCWFVVVVVVRSKQDRREDLEEEEEEEAKMGTKGRRVFSILNSYLVGMHTVDKECIVSCKCMFLLNGMLLIITFFEMCMSPKLLPDKGTEFWILRLGSHMLAYSLQKIPVCFSAATGHFFFFPPSLSLSLSLLGACKTSATKICSTKQSGHNTASVLACKSKKNPSELLTSEFFAAAVGGEYETGRSQRN